MKRLLFLLLFINALPTHSYERAILHGIEATLTVSDPTNGNHYSVTRSVSSAAGALAPNHRINFPDLGFDSPYAGTNRWPQSTISPPINLSIFGLGAMWNDFGVKLYKGKGPVFAGYSSSTISYKDTDNYVECVPKLPISNKVINPAEPGVLEVTTTTNIPNAAPLPGQTAITVKCRMTYLGPLIVPEYVRIMPDVINLHSTAGQPAPGQFRVEIGPVATEGLRVTLWAGVPMGVEVTRDGFPKGQGFNGEPLYLSSSGTIVPASFSVSDANPGARTYSIPISIRYQ